MSIYPQFEYSDTWVSMATGNTWLLLIHDSPYLRPQKNHGLQSFYGSVWSFDFWGKGRPVMVTVKALGHQKNQTKADFQMLFSE